MEQKVIDQFIAYIFLFFVFGIIFVILEIKIRMGDEYRFIYPSFRDTVTTLDEYFTSKKNLRMFSFDIKLLRNRHTTEKINKWLEYVIDKCLELKKKELKDLVEEQEYAENHKYHVSDYTWWEREEEIENDPDCVYCERDNKEEIKTYIQKIKLLEEMKKKIN